MPKIFVGVFVLIAFWSTSVNAAAAPSPTNSLTPDEQKFLAAETAYNKGDLTTYNTLKQQLRSYPLYPYLTYDALTSDLSKATPMQVHEFLTTYPHIPITNLLRTQWVLEMAEQGNWPEVVKTYKSSLKSTRLTCLYLQGLLKTGKPQTAFKQVQPLWLQGTLQPSECAPVFQQWRAAGHLTPPLVKERFQLALENNQGQLAKSLVPYFSPQQQVVAKLWMAAYQNPKSITDPKFLAKAGDDRKSLLAYGFVRYAKAEPDKALPMWPVFVDKYKLSHRLQQRVIRQVGINLARQGNPAAVSWLKQVEPQYATETSTAWIIRSSLATQNWAVVQQGLKRLSPTENNQAIWQYWKARALAATGQPQAAKAIYQRLGNAQNYYGFLSRYQLGEDIKVSSGHLMVSGDELKQLEAIPAIQRARELWILKRYADARREWIAAMPGLTKQQLTAAAVLANRWQWYDRSVKTAELAGNLYDLNIAFPMAYKQTVIKTAKKENMDPAWLFALIRQESAFMMDVSSYVGAMGLMQLMPATAREVAGSLSVKYTGDHLMYDPNWNIQFGTHYIAKMYDKFGSPTVATASYNAGPSAATRWLPKDQAEPADIWVDTIPYRETRNYVKNVMTFTLIYEKQLGEPSEIEDWLKPIQPKK